MPPSTREFSGLDCLSTGVIVLDAADRIQYVNPATETLLGYRACCWLALQSSRCSSKARLLMAVRTARTQQETVIEYEIDVAANGHPPIRLGCSISPQERPQGAMLIEMRAVDPHMRICPTGTGAHAARGQSRVAAQPGA